MDLANLDDSFFQVHEEEICVETKLFTLDNLFMEVMRTSEKALLDGVFRGRLSSELRNKETNWDNFWQSLDVKKKRVTVQFLKGPDNLEEEHVMEHATSLLPKNSCSLFLKSLKADNIANPTLTCCTKILREEGPKMATKHFYETLKSKCVLIPKCPNPIEDHNTSLQKSKFIERQSPLLEKDPSIICSLVEKSMWSKPYQVKEMEDADDVTEKCKCRKCYLHLQSEVMNCEPEELDSDGNGKNCSLYITDLEEDRNNYLYITPNFAMSHLCHLNMLTDLNAYYDGVSFPFVYVAGLHSFFGLHIEDMSLPSMSFNHFGNPKLWIVVAPSEITKLSIILSNYGLHNLNRVCLFKLSHKSNVVFPQFLLHHSIKFKIVIQEPGDFIFLAPNAAHTGGNFGVGVSEACNLGNVDWLPFGSVASTQNCNCLERKVHMDITPLFKMHRPDLLKFHVDGTMAENYHDHQFKRSIIAAHCTGSTEAPPLSTLSSKNRVAVPSSDTSPQKRVAVPSSDTSPQKRVAVPSSDTSPDNRVGVCRVNCPVKGCFTTYKTPVKRTTLMTHIDQEHPKVAKKSKVLADVDKICGRTAVPTGQRYICSDCGTELSVNSNRHKGSEACRKRSAMAQIASSIPK